MTYQTKLHYSDPLLRQAVLSYWRRSVGLSLGFLVVALSVAVAFMLYLGDRGWYVGALSAILVMAVGLIVAIYVSHLHNARAKLRAMGTPEGLFSACEATLSFSSGAGSSTLPWESVKELWRFNDFWLLLFSKSQFVTLPLSDVPSEFREFILERVKASGGVIA